MIHGTTPPAHVSNGIPSSPRASLDPRSGTRGPRVEVASRRFRVRTPWFSTQWLPDTPSNRHVTVVWFRLLVDERGKPLFTLRELARIVGSEKRQAASQHLKDFRQCGEDFRTFVLRKRKVDATVVERVGQELRKTPLAGPTELAARVNAQLGRQDLTAANIQSALEKISCVHVLRTLRRQVAGGHAHYQEAHLSAEILESQTRQAPSRPSGDSPAPIAG